MGKLNFLQNFSIFLIGLSPILFVVDYVGPMWHLNMYLRNISSCSCIVHHIGLVHACQVFDKMFLRPFCTCLDSDEFQTLGIAMFT